MKRVGLAHREWPGLILTTLLLLRAAHRDRSVRNGRSRHTVTVPVPLGLSSYNQTGRWMGRTTPVITVKCTAVNGLDGIDG